MQSIRERNRWWHFKPQHGGKITLSWLSMLPSIWFFTFHFGSKNSWCGNHLLLYACRQVNRPSQNHDNRCEWGKEKKNIPEQFSLKGSRGMQTHFCPIHETKSRLWHLWSRNLFVCSIQGFACILGWPWTYRNRLDSASEVLELQSCATTPG